MGKQVFVTMTSRLESPAPIEPIEPIEPNELDVLSILNETPTEPAFLPPRNPWLRNEQELAVLRTAVKEAEDALRHAQARGDRPITIMRLEQALKSAQRELDTAEYEVELERKRQRVGTG